MDAQSHGRWVTAARDTLLAQAVLTAATTLGLGDRGTWLQVQLGVAAVAAVLALATMRSRRAAGVPLVIFEGLVLVGGGYAVTTGRVLPGAVLAGAVVARVLTSRRADQAADRPAPATAPEGTTEPEVAAVPEPEAATVPEQPVAVDPVRPVTVEPVRPVAVEPPPLVEPAWYDAPTLATYDDLAAAVELPRQPAPTVATEVPQAPPTAYGEGERVVTVLPQR